MAPSNTNGANALISTNDRIKDTDDVGVLLHAIIRYAEANEELLDRSIVSVGYGIPVGTGR